MWGGERNMIDIEITRVQLTTFGLSHLVSHLSMFPPT